MKLKRSFNEWMRCVMTLSALSLLVGCRGPWSKDWKVSDMWSMDVSPWSSDEDEPQTPQRIVGSWTDTVLHTVGKQPQRGFGGRLIFYGDDKEKPILVEGQLVVYAFDETERDPTDNKPTRRYVFPPDQVARRMSKTSLGPSYSFWLPWDDVGGKQTEVSLIARFEPTKGALIMSEQTRHLLPGATTPALIAGKTGPKLPDGVPYIPAQPSLASLEEKARAAAAASGVQLASYDAASQQGQAALPGQIAPQGQLPGPTVAEMQDARTAGDPAAQQTSQRRMTTTSISLPENFRITGSGTPQRVQSSTPTLPGNYIAQSAAPPANVSSVAAPIAVPQATGYYPGMQTMQPMQQLPQNTLAAPGFMTLRQSPLGNGFVAPMGGQQFAQLNAAPTNVGQMGLPPAAPVMPGQPPLTTASGWTTTTYSGPAPTVGYRMDQQPSSGYPQPTPPAPSSPTVR